MPKIFISEYAEKKAAQTGFLGSPNSKDLPVYIYMILSSNDLIKLTTCRDINP